MAEADHILADAELRARMGAAVMTVARRRATTRVKEQFRAGDRRSRTCRIERLSWRLRSTGCAKLTTYAQRARACGAGTLAVQM